MKRDTISLQYILNVYAKPSFLLITNPDENNDIQIVISCGIFKDMEVEDRIDYIFNLIRAYIPDIIKNRLIIVQAFDSEEIIEVLDDVFNDSEFFNN